MPTYLLNWNPDRFDWTNNVAQSAQTRRGIPLQESWSTGGTKVIRAGDRVFLGRQGTESPDATLVRGVIGSSIVVSPVYEEPHWEDPSRMTTYNLIDFDTILTPDLVLPRSRVGDGVLATVRWQTQRVFG